MNRGQWKPGESGNPAGRPKGSTNKNTLRARIFEVLSDHLTVEKLSEDISQLEPKERLFALLKLLEYILPKHRSIQMVDEPEEEEKSKLDLGKLTYDERQVMYKLYEKAGFEFGKK